MKFKTITLCIAIAILTLTGCGSDDSTQHRRRHVQTEDRRTDDIDWDEVDRLTNAIQENNRQMEFMLCQLKLLNHIDLTRDDADAQMNAITDDSKRDSIKAVCGLE
jgi:hypothetical protein